jgi:succinate dehydrogenase / fumarate reductase flavoprotein subunit
MAELIGGYTPEMRESIKKVEASRPRRLTEKLPLMTKEEKDDVLHRFHPDYKKENTRPVLVGPNKGEPIVQEVVDLLEAHPRIDPGKFDLSKVDYETDVLIIGGGGAGCAAAIMAQQNGAKVLLTTKLRLGDANTMMAQGGIQAADRPNDSPAIHYLDVLGGGHFANDPKLVNALVADAPMVIKWLEDLGTMFSKLPDGTMEEIHGGGTSRKRMHYARDYTGGEIMKTIRDEVRNHPEAITIIEFSPVVELILDTKGQAAGAILYNLETEEYFIAKAKSTIVATGGFGRLHIQGFPTTNHYGATCDGVVMGYRAGLKLVHMDTVQYHPTGAAYPEQILGQLVTEKVRGLGAQVLNKNGDQFVYPLEPRDVEAAAIIKECRENKTAVVAPTGMQGVWLDSPMIDSIHGKGTIQKQFPAMYRQNLRMGIDMTKDPILIYPTLHYQNGGLEIDDMGATKIPNLYVAGEPAGGIHGRNRLMGNSLLDVIVFGRRAGIAAAENVKKSKLGTFTLRHVVDYENELKAAGVKTTRIAPMLLPDYTRQETKDRQLTSRYFGTLR